MKTIVDDIKTGNLKHVYLLFGVESYLVRQYVGNLRRALGAQGDSMNCSVFEGEDIDLAQIIDLAETMPFFADHRTIVIKNSGLFKVGKKEKDADKAKDADGEADKDAKDDGGDGEARKGKKKSAAKADAVNPLVDYMDEIPETTYFIFSEDNVDKRSKLYKRIAKVGYAAEFKRRPDGELTRWVLGRLKKEGKKIINPMMEVFFEKTGNDMEIINSELEKLLCYTMGRDVVTAEDVEEICTTQLSDKVFDMIEAIALKEQERALNLYYDLLLLKVAPMMILSLINRQFNILLQLSELAGQGYNTKILAEKLGVRDFVVNKNLRQMRHFTHAQLLTALRDGVRADEDVKSGKMSDRLAVELLIVKFSR